MARAPHTSPTLRRRRLVWAVAALGFAVAFAFPLLVMVAGSLRGPGLPPPRGFEVVPQPVTFEGYRAAFALAPLARAMLNSLVVAAIYVPLAVLTASWAGFALARLRGRARARLIVVVLLLFMVPVTALWISRFAVFEALGLVGTYVPLVAPALTGGSPFFVLLYAFAFRRVPDEIYDAALLEGAGTMRVWSRIAMPLARATTVAVAMLAFVLSWSNFIDPLLYLSREATFTAPLALRYLEQLGPTNWPVLLAGSVAVTAPVVAIFVVAQRSFLGEERGIGWIGR